MNVSIGQIVFAVFLTQTVVLMGQDAGDRSATPSKPTDQRRAAIERGLRWLCAHQAESGSWSFAIGPNPGNLGECTSAATAMGLLPLLRGTAESETEESRRAMEKGIRYLVARIKPVATGGTFYERGGTMYSHGLATTALCEACGRFGDPNLRRTAQSAIGFIVYAQDPVGGGWRYHPRQRGDTSVSGWQITALRHAQAARLDVPSSTLKKASLFLDSVQSDAGSAYGYTVPGNGAATSAIGLLCRMQLGWPRDFPALGKGVQRLLQEGPPAGEKGGYYYGYYSTLAFREFGGTAWDQWRAAVTDQLVRGQATGEGVEGSWYQPTDDHGVQRGGRLYCTSLALLTLIACENEN